MHTCHYNVFRMFRICVEDCVVNGIPFDKGTQVFLPYQHIHKNSDIWPDPEKFDPERYKTPMYQ